MRYTMPKTLRQLITSSILYMVIAWIGTTVAIIESRPARPLGLSTGLPAVQDFLYGIGTAMSPPLSMLIGQAVLTALALRRDRWGVVGVGGLTVAGFCFWVGALIEPILLEIFNPATFDLVKAVLEAGLIIIPLMMVIFGVCESARRRRTR